MDAAVPVQEEMSFSLIEMAVKGGWLMIPLLLLSIMAIYIFGERWWAIRKSAQISPNFMNDIHDAIHQGRIEIALDLCRNSESPIA